MNIRGTATGPAHGSGFLVAALWLFIIVLLVLAVLNGKGWL